MKVTLFFVAFVLSATVAQPQTFSSGSTGADGPAFCPGGAPEDHRQVPDSGIFNFTTVTVNGNCNVFFIPNQRNTPVTILAQGDVVINGTIWLDASGQTPGPGGFFGGTSQGGNLQPGFGPGGGAPGQSGQWVGPLSLVPPIGGSGGGSSHSTCAGDNAGGGGGGAVVIASSTSIQLGGNIFTRGAVYTQGGFCSPGTSGAGGAIRLVANSISGGGTLNAGGPVGNNGIVRIEAQIGQLLYTGSSTPSAVLSPINPTIIPTPTTAALTIASIGGFPVFSDAGVRPGTVDLVLPRALSDPLSVVVQGRNIPVGTQVKMNISGSTGATFTAGTLAGSLAQSLATLTVSGLDRNAETHLFVFATFDVPQTAALLNPSGPDQIAKVRIEAAPGQPSTMAFLRRDGSAIDPKKIPAALLQHFGYQTH
jgi:hypothetical protein